MSTRYDTSPEAAQRFHEARWQKYVKEALDEGYPLSRAHDQAIERISREWGQHEATQREEVAA